MAKIRVAQIKDLSLTVPTTDNGFATLEVGTTTKEVLTRIVPGTPAQGATQSGIMTGIVVAGNTITPEYKSIDQLDLYTKTEVNNKITDAINALDTTSDVTIASEAAGIVTLKAGIKQVDGLIQPGKGTDITLAKLATTGAAADVTIADAGRLIEANTVEGALAELAVDIATLTNSQLSAGTGIEIDAQNKINAKFDISIETREASEGVTAGEYIVIKDGENVIAEVNANAFVKDGFLQSVTKDATTNELVFTWNTDAEGAGEQNQVTRIAISDLCDVYTAKENDWIQLNDFEFSHKTSGVTAGSYGIGDDVTVDSTTQATFKVPALKVDAAGHVTTASEKTVEIKLPASIDTAVQTINGHTVNDSFITTTVTPSNDNKTQTISVTATKGEFGGNNGLATTEDVAAFVEGYVADNVTTEMYRQNLTLRDGAYTLDNEPIGAVAITQNGLDLGYNEYQVNERTVTFNGIEVAIVSDDVLVAYYMIHTSQDS